MKDFLQKKLSDRAQRLDGKAIKEIVELIAQPNIISFAGGLPSPESFPAEELASLSEKMLRVKGAQALQYSDTLGLKALREKIAQRYQNEGVEVRTENVMMVSASQQALDFVSRLLINPGDVVLCGLPSYLGGIDAFKSYDAQMVGIPLDEQGLSASHLEAKVEELIQKGQQPRFLYLVPDFQNPTGITMPRFRRLEILQIAEKYDLLILEDSPYRELRYRGEAQPTFYSLDASGRVITLGTFSKTFVPGFRLGWILAHPLLVEKLALIKQTADICSSTFVQALTLEYLEQDQFDANIQRNVKMYGEKQQVMLNALEEFMPSRVKWTQPEGGLFLWVELPDEINARKLLAKAVEKGVAFVPGDVFHCDGSGQNTFRLNYSYTNREQTREGVKRLADAVAEMITISTR
jgi:2-aminoadipate transaminase